MVPPVALGLILVLAAGPLAAQADPAAEAMADPMASPGAMAAPTAPSVAPFQIGLPPVIDTAVAVRDIFEARAVPVDATAGNASAARDRGLVQGRVAALRQVLERIATREDLARLPMPEATQVIDMVRNFSIANERSSAVRYLAELTVRFDPEAVRALLRGNQIPFTETTSKPVVIVPVVQLDYFAVPTLWDDPNPWRDAWGRLPPRDSLVPVVTPMGDIFDLSTVTVDQAVAKDEAALTALAARYQAGGVVLAVAALSGTPDGEVVQTTLTELRPNQAPEETVLTTVGTYGQAREDLLLAAAQDAVVAIEDSWKRRNRLEFGLTGQLTALVPVEELKDWLVVKERLGEVPLVDRVQLQALTRDRAQVTLYYVGDQNQLELAMAQNDLSLTWQGSVWTIAPARRAAPRLLDSPAAAATEESALDPFAAPAPGVPQ